MLRVKTSHITYRGDNRLDITVKSGSKLGKVFAPSWDMVMGYKKGKISKDEYTKKYYERMRRSYVKETEKWNELLAKKEIVLCCYCKKGDFCHRLLLADILVKLGAVYEGEV
ncbi:MAG: DUF488 family protein [bacterium]